MIIFENIKEKLIQHDVKIIPEDWYFFCDNKLKNEVYASDLSNVSVEKLHEKTHDYIQLYNNIIECYKKENLSSHLYAFNISKLQSFPESFRIVSLVPRFYLTENNLNKASMFAFTYIEKFGSDFFRTNLIHKIEYINFF